MEELESIVQRMIDAGEPEEKIREAVRLYKQKDIGKTPITTEDKTDENWWNQTWLGRGWSAASTTGEATDMLMEGSNVSMDTIQEFIKAKESEAKTHVPSKGMQKFQKQYEKEGKTWSAFFRGVKRDPKLMAELFVQSLGTQLGTFADAPEARAATAIGAGVGAGATWYTGYGALAGGFAGGMGGLATSMESALTFGELIEEELKKEGKEFTDVNIKALLEGPKGKSIRNKSIGRGLTIGAIEGLTGGLAGKTTTLTAGAVMKATKTVGRGGKRSMLAGATTGTGVEAVGGGLGEVGGRLAAGQEMDPAEIGFEAITGTVTAPGNVGLALLKHKTPVYTLNKKEVTYAQMKDFVETADDIDVAKANIKMEHDFTGLGELATKKQNDAITESQIDEKITDKKDRDMLVEFERDRIKAEANIKKKGIDKVPDAGLELATIQAEIDAIIGKYEGALGVGETQTAQDVAKVVRENRISDTIAFAESAGKKIGKDVHITDDNVSAQDMFSKIREEHNKNAEEHNKNNPDDQIKLIEDQDVTDSDGFIVGDSIVINKDVAGRREAINVGAHEVLHGVLAKHLKSLDDSKLRSFISDFRNTLTKDQRKYVEKRLNESYKEFIDADSDWINTTDEWLTLFSDGITKGEITFNEGVFDKLKNTIQEILRKFGINKEFENARQTYNFLKDYQQNVAKGKLSARAEAVAGGGATVTESKLSKTAAAVGAVASYRGRGTAKVEDRSEAVEAVNKIEQGLKNRLEEQGKEYTKEQFQRSSEFNDLFESINLDDGAINNYIKSLGMSPAKTKETIISARNRLMNYDPQAKRKTGSKKEITVGERIMSDIGFAKLDAATELYKKGQETKRTIRIDAEEAMQIEDKPTKTKKASKIEPKARVLKSLADIKLDNKEVISATVRAEIDALIEQNPKNLEEQITKIINKEITKTVKAQMGKISNIKGEVVISEEYKAFMALNYANIVQSLDVNTIKNNYKTLFELTEIGKEDRTTRKADKPGLKKDSYYRKGIYKIETNKAKFTKFFTEGGYTTLLARQKGLANQIAKGITEDVINNEIIENSNDIDAVVQAKLRDFANELNKQKKELRGNYNDQIKFSKSVKKFANAIKNIENPTFEKVKALHAEEYAETVDRSILDEIEKIFSRLGPQITVKEFREAAGEAVITRGKRINFTFYDNVKKFLLKAFPEGNVKELDLMTESGETKFMAGLKGLTSLMDPRILKLSLITNTFLAGNSLYTHSSGTRVNSEGKTVPRSINKDEIPSKYNTKGKKDFKGDPKKGTAISPAKLDKVADLVEEYASKPQTEANQKELASKIRKLITQEDIDAIHSVRDYFYNKLNEYVNQFEEGSIEYYGAIAFVTKLVQIQTSATSGISRQGAVLNSVTLDYSTTRKKARGEGIKRYQLEHNIQVLNFNMNILKSIIDNKFSKVYPLVSSKYSATLLDADAQLVLDSKDGITSEEFEKKYPDYTPPKEQGKTAGADGFIVGMDSEAMFMIALGNAERTLHIPSGLMYDKLIYNKINRNAAVDYLDGVAKKIDSNIKHSKSKKTVFNPVNSNKIFTNNKNRGIFNSILQKSIIQEDVTQEVGELAVRIDNSKFFDKIKSEETIQSIKTLDNAISFSRSSNNESKGITILDFDDTLATTKSLVKFTRPDGTKGTLNAEQYASQYQDLLAQGYKFDFAEFDKVVKAKLAPLFNKALKLQKKFGPESMFILTARPPAAQKAIFDFLKANGLNIPMKNISTLGNSTAEAKALWVAEKVGEGYNDFYFADDALQNTQAVQNMLDQFDVKSKVQQAKVKFSKSMNTEFNNILEEIIGIDSKKRFSAVKARKRGESKGKFRFFIPPSHEDFVGLLYNFMGKGKRGNQHRDFFEETLIRPLNRAYRELNAAKQAIANDFKLLNKQFANVKKKLTKKTPDGDFTYQDAVRVYLWDKHGHKIPGLSETDQQMLVDLVAGDPELQVYAETLNIISKQDTYVNPIEGWAAGDIRTDLDDATGRVGRAQFFEEFNENADIIFSEENLNKIEAAYGEGVVSAIKDILYRTKTGRNRPQGQNKLANIFLNYLNGSVAATMFFNIRSAVLQQMSMVNFINFADNNIFAAAKAFANPKQYWADWAFIFNSDFMKQRRGGIKTDVNGAELAASLRGAKNTPMALLGKLLEFGFKPTQIGDNIAIATGGATFYRNRVQTYIKQGMGLKQAESKAWIDFQVLAEATQQSARPDMVSQQQASVLGKVILAFQNVTSQFNRIGKKAFLDIKNRRITPGNTTQFQSDISNLSRIGYYFAIQNLIFYSLQSALFLALFEDDEDDEKWLKKKERVVNGSIDSVLRGTGVWGAALATIKNMAIAFHKEREKDWNGDEASVLVEALNVSPPLGIKARKIVNAERTLNYNRKVMDEMETFDIDNPMWSAVTSYIEATTNAPTNRMYNKTLNTRQSLNNQNEAYQRALMFGGWSQWNLDIENEKMEKIKAKTKKKKNKKSKTTRRKLR